MNSKRRIFAGALALTLVAAACGSDEDTTAEEVTEEVTEPVEEAAEEVAEEVTPDEEPAEEEPAEEEPAEEEAPAEISGSVNLDGSSTVGPLSEVAAELFMQANPGVQVSVAISGTGGGFEKFCAGETDGNNASREIKDEEIALCEENGISYDNVQVANDALSAVVNPAFPVDCVTPAQLNQIWDEGSTVDSWDDVEGLDLPEESITLFGPGSDSGTFDFFTEAINGDGGVIRNDYTDIGEDDQAAILGVEGDEWALGYIPFSFVQEAGDQVKPLQIDDGEGCKEASLENVQAGEYTPLGRPLFLYASDAALSRPEVVAFFEFYIDNQAEIADLATYVPMNDAQVERAREQVATLAAG